MSGREGKPFSDDEIIAFCKRVVPGWSALPDKIGIELKKFSSGYSSAIVRKVVLKGPGVEALRPNVCVYRYTPLDDDKDDKHVHAMNSKFVTMAGDLGVSEKLYAIEDAHRCSEFCQGEETFAGSETHFVTTLQQKKVALFRSDNRPSNPAVMGAVGKAIGTIHNMPLDWLCDVVGTDEFNKRLANPNYWRVDCDSKVPNATKDRVRSSHLPKDWWASPVWMHADLHAKNIILLEEDGSARLIDWDGLCVGHRGYDLSYFFLNAAGSTWASRRAFAREYLQAHGRLASEKDCDSFLVDLEKCMPLSLAGMIALVNLMGEVNPQAASYMPPVASSLNKLLDEVLVTLDQDVEGKPLDELQWLLEEGLFERLFLSKQKSSACCCIV